MCDQGIMVTYIYMYIHIYSPQQHIAFYKLDTYRPYSVYRGALSSSHASFFLKKIKGKKKTPSFLFFFFFFLSFFFPSIATFSDGSFVSQPSPSPSISTYDRSHLYIFWAHSKKSLTYAFPPSGYIYIYMYIYICRLHF